MDACRRHDHMDVGVVIQLSAMGVQHGGKSGHTLQLLVILRKCFQQFLHTEKHQSIDDFLILPGQAAQLFGQCKGDQKILGGQLFVQLILNPLPAFMVLAMGTAPMSAGVRDKDLFLAVGVGTPGQHMMVGFFSTLLHGP